MSDGIFSLIGAQKTEALHKTIKEFNEETRKFSKRMLHLTWGIILLTFVLVVGLGIQIWIALNS